jgi:histidinol dehydrogenase
MRILHWQELSAAARDGALARPPAPAGEDVHSQARAIIAAVRAEGDVAVRRYTRKFDAVDPGTLRVSAEEFTAAEAALSGEAVAALRCAIGNVTALHTLQIPQPIAIETTPGVHCEQLHRAINAVGLYVPAGSAPLPSSVIMLAIPARLAGCPTRVLCTPPQRDGGVHAAILVAARLCGIEEVYKAGGAQAIAAMAYGTGSIPKVDKIFGPGNAWVTAAKQIVAADPAGAALDLPAGPSEVLVLADESASAEFVAADLLAQAEHDARAHALLVTTSSALAATVVDAVHQQGQRLSRTSILARSMEHIRLIVAPDLEVAIDIAERYAPEHLIIQTRSPRAILDQITSAGSVFLGHWSPEALGDYCSGTNHVLPTYGHARAHGGLSVPDFMRHMSVQEVAAHGLASLGPVARQLAGIEGLDGHAASIDIRLAAQGAGAWR